MIVVGLHILTWSMQQALTGMKEINKRKHKNFHDQSILWVKFSWGEIFMGEGNP